MIPSYRPRPTARRPAIGRFKRLNLAKLSNAELEGVLRYCDDLEAADSARVLDSGSGTRPEPRAERLDVLRNAIKLRQSNPFLWRKAGGNPEVFARLLESETLVDLTASGSNPSIGIE
jgi:hypothetical protein